MNRLDKIQWFINRYDGVLRLALLTIIAVLFVSLLFSQAAEDRSDDQQRDEAVSQAVQEVIDENKEQTADINRQFQAMCVLIIEVSGPQALEQLDPSTEERCRELLSNRYTETAAGEPEPSGPSQPSPSSDRPDKSGKPAPEPSPSDREEQPRNVTWELWNLIFPL